jgi:hypothetical protein
MGVGPDSLHIIISFFLEFSLNFYRTVFQQMLFFTARGLTTRALVSVTRRHVSLRLITEI